MSAKMNQIVAGFACAALAASGGCGLITDFHGYELGTGGNAGAGGGATSMSGTGGMTSGSSTGEGGCSSDFSNDPQNCGVCGHDCLGGACNNGVCGPALLTKGSTDMSSYHIAVDSQYVYWTGGSYPQLIVWSIDKSAPAGSASQALTSSVGADYLAVDEMGAVYFTVFADNGKIGVIKDNMVTDFAVNEDLPIGITYANGYLYWGRHRTDGAIRKKPADGSSEAMDVATGVNLPRSLRAHDSTVYWSHGYDMNDGGVTTQGKELIPGISPPAGLAQDDSYVYALDRQARVWKVKKTADFEVTQLALGLTGQPEMLSGGIAVDSKYVYWTGIGAETCAQEPCGAIHRIDKNGGIDEIIAADATRWTAAGDLAVDDKAVYWTANDAQIFRQVKPAP